jgi:predicted O-linked N-acetylglucosamine transferase (SPINDLY family)
MSRFFELHNKESFETFAFSFGPNINDLHRKRLVKSFDKFFNVEEENDFKIIELSRENRIDIAVDLKGFTKHHRLGIFAKRVAPIQVNYLGYPGTIGNSFMDYIVADKIVIPKKNQNYFSEKIIYLPNSYQVNDNTKEISGKKFERKDFNLPNNCFVFCCFNNSYKINPIIFNVWMNILKKTKNSILWLLEENFLNKKNILKEAKNLGVLEDRIIFADKIKNAEHLARHKLADLFLDTLPCNAHTTASDALWSGLPILTCLGKNFQGRVAASLLNSVGLSNLITKSLDEYERLAIQFASKEKNIIDIKNKLYNNLKSSSLFNTEIFTSNMEKAYKEIYERYKSNLKPDNIVIK